MGWRPPVGSGGIGESGACSIRARYPHRQFGSDAARRFAECYLAMVRRVVDGTEP